jgi:hypothetical protein
MSQKKGRWRFPRKMGDVKNLWSRKTRPSLLLQLPAVTGAGEEKGTIVSFEAQVLTSWGNPKKTCVGKKNQRINYT